MKTDTTILLAYPVDHEGLCYEQLTLRRLTVRDRLAVQDRDVSPARQEIALAALAAGVPEEVILELDIIDYDQVQRALAGFFPPPPKTSAAPSQPLPDGRDGDSGSSST
jgi:hypothetical protein